MHPYYMNILERSRCFRLTTRITLSGARCLFSVTSKTKPQHGMVYSNDSQSVKNDFSYCVNVVKERDGEGYLCGLLLPSSIQKPYFALRAFNVEIASIKDSQSIRRQQLQSMPMPQNDESSSFLALQMRMQWWKNAIDEIYSKNDPDRDTPKPQLTDQSHVTEEKNIVQLLSQSCWNSPIVRSLDRCYVDLQQKFDNKTPWTKRFAERLIDARENDLFVTQYATMEEQITYADESVSSLLYLMLESCGESNNEAETIAYHAGVGIGLATVLRSTPFRSNYGEIPIPKDLIGPNFPYEQLIREFYGESNENTTINDIEFRHPQEAERQLFLDAVAFIAHGAMEHFHIARSLQSKAQPKSAKPCLLLSIIPSLHYLNKLQDVKYNVFHATLVDPNAQRLKLLFLLSRTWLTGVL